MCQESILGEVGEVGGRHVYDRTIATKRLFAAITARMRTRLRPSQGGQGSEGEESLFEEVLAKGDKHRAVSELAVVGGGLPPRIIATADVRKSLTGEE